MRRTRISRVALALTTAITLSISAPAVADAAPEKTPPGLAKKAAEGDLPPGLAKKAKEGTLPPSLPLQPPELCTHHTRPDSRAADPDPHSHA